MYKCVLLIILFSNVCFSFSELPKITQLFQEKKFVEIISNFSIDYVISNKEMFTDTGIYLYAKTLFALEDYKKSLKIIENIEKPNEDIRKLRFFIFLNLTNIDYAKREQSTIKEDRNFLNSLINFIEKDYTNATKNLLNYIQSEEEKNFNFEALIIDYTYNFQKENFLKTLDIVLKKSLIDETKFIETKSKKSPFKDFIIYKKCINLIEEGKKEEAKIILFELIKNSESLIIKNLSSYEYQKLN